MKVLDSVRVLEIGGLGPGPFCAMHLADLGADVIKIERPGAGDQRRATLGRPLGDLTIQVGDDLIGQPDGDLRAHAPTLPRRIPYRDSIESHPGEASHRHSTRRGRQKELPAR